jgi:hypothetical protein
MSANQFVERIMDERSTGLEGPERDRARRTAYRLARRWLSRKKQAEQLVLQADSRRLLSGLFGLPEAVFLPTPRSTVEERLDQVEMEIREMRRVVEGMLPKSDPYHRYRPEDCGDDDDPPAVRAPVSVA